jgi:hypothetical protein
LEIEMRSFFAPLAAAALTAIALPTFAQEVPANSGPYYAMSLSDQEASFAAAGTRARLGSEASVTISNISAIDRGASARLDMAHVFNCDSKVTKVVSSASYDANGRLLQVFDPLDWSPVREGSLTATYMKFACDGALPDGAAPLEFDINSIVAKYRQIAADY